ncbi:MAG: DegV family protein [Parasporobacterium sp.]|nr:DegV family protein [Parasporobacterium sp.]
MEKVKITTDSVCDLSPDILKRLDVPIISLHVILGEDDFSDGVNIVPEDIFKFVEKTGTLPKTSMCSVAEYEEFYEKYLEDYDTLVMYSISSKCSASYQNACIAAEKYEGRVFNVDSAHLSTGQGLMVMKACDWRDEGCSAAEIVERSEALKSKIQTSFVVDTTEYLYKGGRCTAAERAATKLLSIHPSIHMVDGELGVKGKYRGNLKRCILKYVEDLAREFTTYDKSRVFVTHSMCEPEVVEAVKALVKEKFSFDEVIETYAGSVVTSHCGQGTLGVLFITE